MQTPVASEATKENIAALADAAGLSHVHMLAWRDLDDDEAGGSEVHAHSIAAIWAQSGIQVTMRTSFSKGRPTTATRAGYTVSRKASRYGVFVRSPLSEVTGRLGPCDGLIEIWNGMPFWSPVWWRGPRVIWLHHVHGPMWGQSLPAPVAKVGVTLEERIAPRIYRNQPIVTLSESSRVELVEDLKFPDENVCVISPGINPYFSPGGERNPTPLVVAVGRLTPVKDFPRLVRVMDKVHDKVPDVKLVIVGEGYERERIEAQIASLDAGGWVSLPGRISDDELLDLYRSAWAVSSASTREGWGMTLTEAAACGTPAVASDITGHTDAIDVGRSGLVGGTDDEIAARMVDVLTDESLRARLVQGALDRASELTWEHAAVANFEQLAADAVRRRPR